MIFTFFNRPFSGFMTAIMLILLGLLLPAVNAGDNGMDMNMDDSMLLASGTMKPYLHFTPGDVIWFLGWVPQSGGAMAGASIGLFLLALVDRWLAAIQAGSESHWRRRALVIQTDRLNAPANGAKPRSMLSSLLFRTSLPFILPHDVARGILYVAHAALGFAFMLVVMTYQVSFIISIVVGKGVGEMLFGRYISAASTH